MGKPTGFMEYPRRKTPWRDPVDRALDYYEIYTPAEEEQLKKQGARCMNCGVPFCESDHGCPIDNLIPEWNDLVYKGKWKEAYHKNTQGIQARVSSRRLYTIKSRHHRRHRGGKEGDYTWAASSSRWMISVWFSCNAICKGVRPFQVLLISAP